MTCAAHSGRSVASLEKKSRPAPWRARAPKSATAAVTGSTTGISTRRRVEVARARRISARATNAADHAAAIDSPTRPRSWTTWGRAAASSWLAGHAWQPCSTGSKNSAEATPSTSRLLAYPSASRPIAGRLSERARYRSAACASNGGHAANSTSPTVKAAPAPGLFHSTSSQATAESAASTRNAPLNRVTRAAAISSSPAAISAVNPMTESPASESPGAARTIATVTATAASATVQATTRSITARSSQSATSVSNRRENRLNPGAATLRAFHAQTPAEGLDPVRQPAQPRPAARVRPTDPVVADHDPQLRVRRGHIDVDTRRVRVLGDVRERLRADVVRDELLGRREATIGHGERDRDA